MQQTYRFWSEGESKNNISCVSGVFRDDPSRANFSEVKRWKRDKSLFNRYFLLKRKEQWKRLNLWVLTQGFQYSARRVERTQTRKMRLDVYKIPVLRRRDVIYLVITTRMRTCANRLNNEALSHPIPYLEGLPNIPCVYRTVQLYLTPSVPMG